MDRTGYDAVWLAEHHFTTSASAPRCTWSAPWPRHGPKAAHRHGGVARPVLPSAAPRRGGGAARHPVRRPGQLGCRPRLRARRVQRLRGAARGERVAVSRDRRDRAAGLDRRAAEFPRPAFRIRGCRGAAQAGAAAAPAGLGGRRLGGGDRMGGRPRLLDPDGPAFIDARDRRASAGSIPRSWWRRGSPTRAATSRWRAWSRWRRAGEAAAVARSGAEWILNSYSGRAA